MAILDLSSFLVYGKVMIDLTSLSGSQVNKSASSKSISPLEPVGSNKSLATTMPSERQTSLGLSNVDVARESAGNYEQWKKSKIFHPKQSKSALTSEKASTHVCNG